MLRRVELLRRRQASDADRCLDGALERLRAAFPRDLIAPTLPGGYNGRQCIRRGVGESAARGALAVLDENIVVDGATFEEIEAGGAWQGNGVYRVLLLRVRDGADPAAIRRFERETLAMPRYIPAIRGWRLGRVVQAQGARVWTHVWEQRYDTLSGLLGGYMLSAYHWGYIDRWFDVEYPEWLVDTHLCHSFCACRVADAGGLS